MIGAITVPTAYSEVTSPVNSGRCAVGVTNAMTERPPETMPAPPMPALQGLLVHAAWYHYHWRTYHTHMYMLLQMSTAVVADLALDRQEGFGMQDIPTEERGNDRWSAHKAAGQRALLGCYYLCSK